MSNSVIITIDPEKEKLLKECDELIKRLRDKHLPTPTQSPLPAEPSQDDPWDDSECPF